MWNTVRRSWSWLKSRQTRSIKKKKKKKVVVLVVVVGSGRRLHVQGWNWIVGILQREVQASMNLFHDESSWNCGLASRQAPARPTLQEPQFLERHGYEAVTPRYESSGIPDEIPPSLMKQDNLDERSP